MQSVLFVLFVTMSFASAAQAQITQEQLASLCKYGAPDGLASMWVKTGATRVLDSIASQSLEPVVLSECTRSNSSVASPIVNGGDECRFDYSSKTEDELFFLKIPAVLKSRFVDTEYGRVIEFEPGARMTWWHWADETSWPTFEITNVCKREDGTGGYFAIYGDEGVAELNPEREKAQIQ